MTSARPQLSVPPAPGYFDNDGKDFDEWMNDGASMAAPGVIPMTPVMQSQEPGASASAVSPIGLSSPPNNSGDKGEDEDGGMGEGDEIKIMDVEGGDAAVNDNTDNNIIDLENKVMAPPMNIDEMEQDMDDNIPPAPAMDGQDIDDM
ncbi:MAG: hypothetical protein Q9169_008770, partial [Polycauliona sp. 2 TL-2023]